MKVPNSKKETLLPEIADAVLANDDLVNEIRKVMGLNFRFLSVQRQLRNRSAKLGDQRVVALVRKGLGIPPDMTITTPIKATKKAHA